MKKKEQPRRRSLNDRLDAELASAESIPVAGINNENQPQSPTTEPKSPQQEGGGEVSSSPSAEVSTPSPLREEQGAGLPTKKAPTIMPKEVFIAQRYCTDTDTPKHRALYLFIVDGLHRAGHISDAEAQRFRDMATLLTTTYEKK